MGFISDRVAEEYKKSEECNTQTPVTIHRDHVEEAINVLRTLPLRKTREVFYYLSAINLLNAAIKQTEYKKELGYGFIKGKALLATKIIITRYRYDDIKYYYYPDMLVLLLSV